MNRQRDLLQRVADYHRETYEHLENVRLGCYALAKALGYGDGHAEAIANAGLYHDVGKLYIAQSTLLSPDPLTVHERAVVQRHPERGAALAESVGTGQRLARWISLHHERLDGSGYPFGLRGSDIPHEVQILAVVDIYDAIAAPRPYAKKRTASERITELDAEAQAGRINPEILQAYLEITQECHLSSSRSSLVR